MALVELQPIIPDAIFDMRYARSDNITGEVLYRDVEPRLEAEAAQALARAAHYFLQRSLVLVIWDAHRPDEAHEKLRAVTTDERYVLKVSNHPKGLAVDGTLAIADGSGELDMGTDFDDFTERAHVGATDLLPHQVKNRAFLAFGMKQAGFRQWPYEWWHFDFVGENP